MTSHFSLLSDKAPYRPIHTGPTADRYADWPLSGGTTKIERRRSISIVGSRLTEKSTVGGRLKKKKGKEEEEKKEVPRRRSYIPENFQIRWRRWSTHVLLSSGDPHGGRGDKAPQLRDQPLHKHQKALKPRRWRKRLRRNRRASFCSSSL
ncbi:hypothetical protein BHE74_00036813 [Ensete ventricosum]|nr:hypothetical protein BHE74_00036813 [Ensete ventricosum]